MAIHRPKLVHHARYRWDRIRGQHQLVFPEGMLVLNDSGAAIVKACDGSTTDEIIARLQTQFSDRPVEEEVLEFLERLAQKGLVRDVDS